MVFYVLEQKSVMSGCFLNKVECRLLSWASVDLLLENIQIYDLKKIQNIIIYVSGNDTSQNIDIEFIEEHAAQCAKIAHLRASINIWRHHILWR